MQCALVLQHPGARRSARRGARRASCATCASTSSLSPALGGLIIGHEVARGLGVRALFAERQEGVLTLRRGFTLAPGERVLIVEDVVTTGGSTRETMAVARAAGAEVVGAAAIINRGGDRRSRRAVPRAGRCRLPDLARRSDARLARRDSGHEARLAEVGLALDRTLKGSQAQGSKVQRFKRLPLSL